MNQETPGKCSSLMGTIFYFFFPKGRLRLASDEIKSLCLREIAPMGDDLLDVALVHEAEKAVKELIIHIPKQISKINSGASPRKSRLSIVPCVKICRYVTVREGAP